MDWTKLAWRMLCMLAVTSALTVFTPLWWILSPLWQAVAVAPGLIVTLILLVAAFADSSRDSSQVGAVRDQSISPSCTGGLTDE